MMQKSRGRSSSSSSSSSALSSSFEITKVNRVGLATVLVLALTVCCCSLSARAHSEPSPSIQTSGDASSEQFAPKRQYFISPRIGRSMQQQQQRLQPNHLVGVMNGGQQRNTQAIWSALEEASPMAAGQIQPSRGYPGPLRSSLLFLLGNRRLIGPRSGSGLMPQPRIGRRAAPSGLLPQPRVGRRSLPFESDLEDSNFADGQPAETGQQEVAIATLSDNAALNEAVEALMDVIGNAAASQPDGQIARPSRGSTAAFVPRLGKRFDRVANSLCAGSQDCSRLALLGALVKGVISQPEAAGSRVYSSAPLLADQLWLDGTGQQQQQHQLFDDVGPLEQLLLDAQRQQQQQAPRLETRAPDGSAEELAADLSGASGPGVKRVAFTPRIGR